MLKHSFYLILGSFIFTYSYGVLAKPPLEVIGYQLAFEPHSQTLNLLGHLQAKKSILISANTTEIVEKIHFKEGQKVEKNEPLIELNSQEEKALLEVAKVAVDETKRQYDRVKGIEGRGSVTRALIDEKYSEWQTALANRKVIESRLKDRQIIAPFEGTLGFTNLAEGSLVTSGTEMVSLDDMSEMKLDLYIAVKHLRDLRLNQPLIIQSDAFPNRVFKGRISAISPRLEPDLRMVHLRALIPNPDRLLKTNMMVKAEVNLPVTHRLKIPNSAVLMLGDDQFVYRLIKQQSGLFKVQKVAVKTGEIGADYTDVLAGLNDQDIVVSQGVMRVKEKNQVSLKTLQNNRQQSVILKPKNQRSE